ncbi:vacuolar SNARE Vsl1/Vam7 [Schizosaccharomyces pombe]|uniref:Vacuolar morphogenesis protein 7 homolog n=1 Tax=Schizosaccharomyces pombe (strain 972 / ATCC 24843) TaxID=284812 RepID=VAM7_SCHPO|nr:putative SNARE protein Vam7 [Schizosaccharomyces pombe]O74509.1 RecName: Full=Vacuolar morphogenesis protein 7 homolog [Schizosaccharomyces pombe 972h-]CAA20665.1 vacuolar SNARE Vam7 (predicted) [Schizosaccharomyces pombe]|eukprot:NP_587792.1 putative SNARE protein Vam7 [Schizosaccharomyces pombe]
MALKIKIPETSQSSDEYSRWTVYHIEVAFPNGGKHVVFRRFNEFVALDAQIRPNDYNSRLCKLPSKSWVSSTVTNEKLRESRRLALQAYVQCLSETPWIKMPVVKKFLNIKDESEDETQGQFLGPTDWIQVFQDCKRNLHMYRVDLMSGKSITIGVQTKNVYAIKSLMDNLSESLDKLELANALGPGEILRRKDMLEQLGSEFLSFKRLVKNANSPVAPPSASSQLNSSNPSSPFRPLSASTDKQSNTSLNRVLGKNRMPETQTTKKLDNVGLYNMQNQTMEDQDMQAESLLPIIQRQKELSKMINQEVVEQNSMLDELSNEAYANQKKLHRTRAGLRKLG